MTERVALHSYLQDIPGLSAPLIPAAEDPQLMTSVAMPENYVWPDIEEDGQRNVPILLVSAPGAMGKSYTARAIAHSLNVPFVDLSGIRVGSNTLLGRFFRCLGPSLAQNYLTDVSEGRASLILDGTDEAQLLAGREHYIDFLQDIADVVRGGRGNRQVILLGRPDAMLSTEAALYSYGIPFSRAQLSAFSMQQSNEMLDRTLDTTSENGRPFAAHRTHRVPYEVLRDTVLQDISAALGNEKPLSTNVGWEAVEEFLGYPPVLLALAARLRTDNFHNELNRMQNDVRSDRRKERGELLQEVVEHILDRESSKVRARLQEALGLAANDPKVQVLYTRSEQVLRILIAVSGAPASVQSPAVLAAGEKAIYDEQIAPFVHDHPFLMDNQIANVVFSDYVRAFVYHAEEEQLHGLDRAYLLKACPVLGPFFVHFAHSLFGGVLHEEILVDALIKSFIAGTRDESLFSYSQDVASSAHLSLMSGDRSKQVPSSHLGFHIFNPSGVVELTSPVARGVVVSPYAAVLTDVQGSLEIGPGLTVVTSEIELGGNQLVVNGYETDSVEGSILFALDNLSHSPNLKIAVADGDHLSVHFPNPSFQWRQHFVPLKLNRPDSVVLNQLLVATRRILIGFRSSATDPSLYCEMLDNLVVGNSAAAKVALSALRELEIVERRGDNYVLATDRLQPFGFSYVDLTGPKFAEKIQPLIESMQALTIVAEFLLPASS